MADDLEQVDWQNLSTEEKNNISARAKALKVLKKKLPKKSSKKY